VELNGNNEDMLLEEISDEHHLNEMLLNGDEPGMGPRNREKQRQT